MTTASGGSRHGKWHFRHRHLGRNYSADEMTQPIGRRRLHYEPAFDGLRGAAVLVVIATHAIPTLPMYGGLGVNIFFVLSGYLITRLLVVEMGRTGTINLGRFYLQRALRLMPPLWAMLLLFLPFILTGHHRTAQLHSWTMAASYLMNFNSAFGWGQAYAFFHTWSLAAQEQFYLLWPLALLVGIRRHPKLILSALLVFAIIWRTYLYANGASMVRIYFSPDTNSDAILIGCLLGFAAIPAIWVRRLAAMWPLWLFAIGGALVFFARLPDVPQYLVELPLVSILGALLVITAPVSALGNALSAEPLRSIGKISYGLYLWHLPLIIFFDARWHLSGWQLLFPIACAFALATASYFTVEAWARQLKNGLKRETRSSGLAAEVRYAPEGGMPP